MGSIAIVGGGLAGCECALTLADAGIPVLLFEQKPLAYSAAHKSPNLAELVCSNSLRSAALTSGVGLLKQEMRDLGSHCMAAADASSVPADKALAVDREAFSRRLTEEVQASPYITRIERVIRSLDDPALADPTIDCLVIAAGPLVQEDLSRSLAECIGQDSCYFYDAIAPIVWTQSLDHSIVFRASRYECDKEGFEPSRGTGDYLNCPMTQEEYVRFYAALTSAETVASRDFEKLKHFEGCMPIEALAARGERTLTFGPMKPVGFIDPRTGRRPYAVLQLRAETRSWETVNLVGCQTRMRYADQERVFRLVPGLERAEFVRLGSMHRNTFVNAPQVLTEDLMLKARPNVYLAGQITGVEGYVESAACGLWLGYKLRSKREGQVFTKPPAETALGGLLRYLEVPSAHFQPSNAHFGLLPEISQKMRKIDRKQAYLERARAAFAVWKREMCGIA
ncbi:MAG: methylenetetrahydrofolate--tRNA-(uracil(54)-C(5))-methyltransferase (FADH(2)-oxidizing) TrmFO [Desulfovibrionaceae bacterium]|nr:methylenetetrahydrofolate--tRNA-(uracil(54)-C(5))-methyltransferase (FADH(2)-oxidizing) TrmFO [Desulfovibrionaceae bacterium]